MQKAAKMDETMGMPIVEYEDPIAITLNLDMSGILTTEHDDNTSNALDAPNSEAKNSIVPYSHTNPHYEGNDMHDGS